MITKKEDVTEITSSAAASFSGFRGNDALRCLRCDRPKFKKMKSGPDGFRTLCKRCFSLYSRKDIHLYKYPDGTISVREAPGSRPVKIVGFDETDFTLRFLYPLVEDLHDIKPVVISVEHSKTACGQNQRSSPSDKENSEPLNFRERFPRKAAKPLKRRKSNDSPNPLPQPLTLAAVPPQPSSTEVDSDIEIVEQTDTQRKPARNSLNIEEPSQEKSIVRGNSPENSLQEKVTTPEPTGLIGLEAEIVELVPSQKHTTSPRPMETPVNKAASIASSAQTPDMNSPQIPEPKRPSDPEEGEIVECLPSEKYTTPKRPTESSVRKASNSSSAARKRHLKKPLTSSTKVYKTPVSIKATFSGLDGRRAVRRFTHMQGTSFQEFIVRLRTMFDAPANFLVSYIDEEGDRVDLTDENEFAVLLALVRKHRIVPVRINVDVPPQEFG